MSSHLGVGVGLRPPHYTHILSHRPQVSWFEAITENYLGIEGGSGARPLEILRQVREHYPVVLHGVSLSIGSTDPLSLRYLDKVKALADDIEPAWLSDHLCWAGTGDVNLHDLLPLPYTEEALRHLVPRIEEAQEHLKRPLLLENVSSYVEFTHSEMTEWEFLSELSRMSGCKLLLDINNVYVSSRNHGFDPLHFLNGIPPESVGQFHLAGHSDLGTHLIDTHDHPVCDTVWDLYRHALTRFGTVPTLIEWDDKLPEFAVLEAEARRAERVQAE